MLHWSKGPPGVLCVQHAEGGVVVVGSHGAGVQVPGPTLTPCLAAHSSDVVTTRHIAKGPHGAVRTQHWIPPGVLVVVVVVVEVLVATGQRGRPASPVQVQESALHWLITLSTQLLEGLGPHASLISSLHAVVLSHLPLWSAIADEETKTPTPSATAANATIALRVIVEPPLYAPVPNRAVSRSLAL